MAAGDGGPIYCLMSALSTNARSIAPVTLEVVSIITLGYLLIKAEDWVNYLLLISQYIFFHKVIHVLYCITGLF